MKLSKKRILFFAYDGVGLGHLMRLLKISKAFAKEFDILVATGHQAVGDLIPEGVEYIRLPKFSDNKPEEEVKSCSGKLNVKLFRNNALWYIIKLFKPDVFVTDYLPAGKKNELMELLTNYPCLKYFILRNNIGSENLIINDVFTQENIEALNRYYRRIFIAGEEGLDDFSRHPAVPDSIRKKICYVGYIVDQIDYDVTERIRVKRGLKPGDHWIVCSAGGGRLGERLIEKCLSIAKDPSFSSHYFDIVSGYYGDFEWPSDLYDVVSIAPNVTLSKKNKHLAYMHAAADIVICSGGYNSLTEAMQGRNKHILAFPVQLKSTEQIQNIHDLQKYYPIQEIKNLEDLGVLLNKSLGESVHGPIRTDKQLNMEGAYHICQIIKSDLSNDSHL